MEELKPKVVVFSAIDGGTGEIIYLEMEEEAFIEWEKHLEEEEKLRQERRKELSKLEHDLWRYLRDD
jgi:hypothetical protein